ncbi:unnamed protein product, partial [Prorocentrum cordatum]
MARALDGTDYLLTFAYSELYRNSIVANIRGTPGATLRAEPEGDAVGVLLDCERREVAMWVNDRCLGVVFRAVPLPLTPAVQVEAGQACHLGSAA